MVKTVVAPKKPVVATRDCDSQISYTLSREELGVYATAYHVGPWHPECGWVWDTGAGTVKILKALELKGLVKMTREKPHGSKVSAITYTPVPFQCLPK